MEIDFQKIKHNYIKRVVIYAIFLYRNQSRNQDVYKKLITEFCKKRTGLENVEIEVGPKMNLADQRNDILRAIFQDDESSDVKPMSRVLVKFKTGFKTEELQVNLNDSEKYMLFLDQ